MAAHNHSFKITNVKQETEDTISYELQPLKPELFSYKAGQFLTFLFDFNGRHVRRPYSLTTAPEVEESMRILVKRIPNGEVSRHIHDTWKIGDIVHAMDASGKFVLEADPLVERDIFLFAAGSGIAPIMGIMKRALHKYPNAHIKLYYSNSTLKQAIFLQEIEQLYQSHPDRLLIEHLISASKFLNKSRLNRFRLEELVNRDLRFDKQEALFYTCGPYDYMQLCEIVLRGMNFDKAHIKKEIFTVPEDEGDDDAEESKGFELKDRSQKSVKIHMNNQTYEIKVAFPETILSAALKQNIELPYSCMAGQCSTCTAKCISGEVVMSFNAVLTHKDEKNGLILTCKGHPVSEHVVLTYEA